MKFKKICIVVLIPLLILFPKNVLGIVNIEGQVVGNINKEANVFTPINNFSNYLIPSSIPIDVNGNFKINFSVPTTFFITIFIDKDPIWLIVEPDDSIALKIDINNSGNKNWLKIKGRNAKGNEFFNEFNYDPSKKYIPIWNIFENLKSNRTRLLKSINDSIAQAIFPFTIFFQEKSISYPYYNLVVKNIYANLLCESLKFFFRSSRVHSIYSNNDIDSLKKSIFQFCDPLDSDLTKGLNTDYYIYYYFLNKELTSKNRILQESLSDTIIVINNTNTLLQKDFVPFLHIKNGFLRENLWGAFLFNLATIFNDKIGLQQTETFRLQFPQSLWIRLLDSLSASLSDSVSVNVDIKKIVYLDSSFYNGKLSDVIKYFYGRPIFIDIWASWCIPCRQEFLYKATIDSFLLANEVSKLYISVDNALSRNIWISVIQKYNLEGCHILANRQLINDLQDKIYINEGNMPIPRYVIVNKKGQIINNNANRPSSKEALLKQLKQSLELDN